MCSGVANPAVAKALDSLTSAVGAVQTLGMAPVDARDAAMMVREVEAVARQVAAVQVALVGEVDRRGLHRTDGHSSAKVFVRHAADLSDREAGRRTRASRALRDLPLVRERFEAGAIGIDHLHAIAHAHANPRVRARFCRRDGELAELAGTKAHRLFDLMLTDWVRRVDEDGTCDTAQRKHDDRDARFHQEFDGGWQGDIRCGSLYGAELHAILDHFTQAELLADWEKARAEHGDAATAEHLPRTDAQRRFDAFQEIMRRGADSLAGTGGGPTLTVDIVIDQATFERELRRMTDAAVGLVDDRLDTTAPDPINASRPPERPAGDGSAGSSGSNRSSGLDSSGSSGPGCPSGSSGSVGLGSTCDDRPPGPSGSDCSGPDSSGSSGSSGSVGLGSTREPPDLSDPPVGSILSDDATVADAPSSVGYRCSTLDGHTVDPTETVLAALTGHVRRVVVGAAGVVIDLGRRSRCFTGPAQLAVRLGSTHCVWPGCHVPVSHCQTDHLVGWRGGGRTDPGNGAPTCGQHNRLKEHGFSVHRDLDGRWHTHRPDGSEIT